MSVEVVKEMMKSFFPYAQKRMGFVQQPSIDFVDDLENAEDPLGKTAHYDPKTMTISLYVSNRHPVDIIRSLSHELIHHTQNCCGKFKENLDTGEGYAQKNSHLREIEREAYEQGNLIFRDFQDMMRAKRKKIRIIFK